jgi:L,D-transpeptidase YcbB
LHMLTKHLKTFQYTNSKLISLGLLFLLLGACRSTQKTKDPVDNFFTAAKFDEDDFAEVLAGKYPNRIEADTWQMKKMHTAGEMLQYTYQQNDYLPLWVTEEGNADVADALVKELESLKEEGLDPKWYKVDELKMAIQKFRKDKETDVKDVLALDTTCTQSYIRASKDLLFGRIKPSKADSLWFHDNDTVWKVNELLISSLINEEKYPSLSVFRSQVLTYKILLDAKKHYAALYADSAFMKAKQALKNDRVGADSLLPYIIKKELPMAVGTSDDSTAQGISLLIRSFQEYYGLNPTNKLDDRTFQYMVRTPDSVLLVLDANLERTRWLPQQLEATHVVVDIPMMELYLRRDGKNIMTMRTIVGKTARQTPSLNALMTNVIFNPSWGVPPTIMKNDVLPGMAKSGKAYLDKKGLKAYDFKGNPVNASHVNASNYKQYIFKQAPGDDNALGYIKFNMPNDHDIYLHDTPHRELFDTYDRAQSSGCVRVQEPKELAEYILTVIDDKTNYNRDKIDSVIRTQKTKYQGLANDVPVHIIYFTAFENRSNNGIQFSRDIYKRDLKLIDQLKNG